MIDFLNWTTESDFAITSPQVIAYRDEDNNVTRLPSLQFVAQVEELHNLFYPVIFAVDNQGLIVFKTAYREHSDFDSAFNFAKEQVEGVFQGSYEDGVLRHDALNGWAFEIGLKLGLDKPLIV